MRLFLRLLACSISIGFLLFESAGALSSSEPQVAPVLKTEQEKANLVEPFSAESQGEFEAQFKTESKVLAQPNDSGQPNAFTPHEFFKEFLPNTFIPQTLPHTTPESLPQASAPAVPEPAPQTSVPQASLPQAAPEAVPQAAVPQAAAPQETPAPQVAPEAVPQVSAPQSVPEVVPQATPQSIPQESLPETRIVQKPEIPPDIPPLPETPPDKVQQPPEPGHDPSVPPLPIPEPVSVNREEIDKEVRFFSGLGHHRCGSIIDLRAAKWIETKFKRLRLGVVKESYTFTRPISRTAMVSMKIDRINSRILPGMPLLNAKPTGERPISGELGFVGQDNTIPVIHVYVTPTSGTARLRAESLEEFKTAVASGRYRAVIGVTQGGYAGLVPLSIDLDRHYPTPAMLLSSDIGNFAEIYAEINNPVKFNTQIRYEKTKAYNVIGKIAGTNPALASHPIVVIVPRSAWWSAAAERGTGVAAMLSSAKVIKARPPKRPIYFVSTTGQEYYLMGVQRFLHAHPDLLQNAYAWIYVGANVGTKPLPHYLIQLSSHQIEDTVKLALEDSGVEMDQVRWIFHSRVSSPSLAQLFAHSPRAIFIAAVNNRCERMTCDQWPETVNTDATLSFTKALIQLLEQLGNSSKK